MQDLGSYVLQLPPRFLDPPLKIFSFLVLLVVPEGLRTRDRLGVSRQGRVGSPALPELVGDRVVHLTLTLAVLRAGERLEGRLHESLAPTHQVHVLRTAKQK